jgi:hypothetical protein
MEIVCSATGSQGPAEKFGFSGLVTAFCPGRWTERAFPGRFGRAFRRRFLAAPRDGRRRREAGPHASALVGFACLDFVGLGEGGVGRLPSTVIVVLVVFVFAPTEVDCIQDRADHVGVYVL